MLINYCKDFIHNIDTFYLFTTLIGKKNESLVHSVIKPWIKRDFLVEI